MSSIGFLAPMAYYFGYRERLEGSAGSERRFAIIYGFFLMISSVVCGFNMPSIIKEVGGLNLNGGFWVLISSPSFCLIWQSHLLGR
jgi:hypothetical protein